MSTTPSSSSSSFQNLEHLGLGYAIAFALGFPFLVTTIVLLSYLFCRERNPNNRTTTTTHIDFSGPDGQIVLPRIIFVAENHESEQNDGNPVPGLDQAAINSYPKFPYAKPKGGVAGDGVCSICLCEYREGEMLRMTPECCHQFHLMCVDAWLKINASCPVCRTSPLPTPMSTPHSELVPLSQHFDGRGRT